jgi:hypothetical protein
MCSQYIDTNIILHDLQCRVKIWCIFLVSLFMTICSSKNIGLYQYPRPAHVMHNMVQWKVHARVPVDKLLRISQWHMNIY